MLNRFVVAGFPKAGKSGSLACLLDAGYTLRYLDFDKNSHPIEAYASAEGRARFQRVECIDKAEINPATGGVMFRSREAVPTAMKALNQWPDGTRAQDWGAEDILVIDSGSVMAESAMQRNMLLNQRAGKRPQFGDYTAAHDTMTNLFLAVKSTVQCHFLFLTHLFLMGPDLSAPDFDNDALAEKVVERKLEGAENVPWQLAPKTVGRALHDLAKHFSGVIYVRARGLQRRLILHPEDGINAGVSIPGLPPELPIETGMAKIFEASKKL